MWGKFQSGKILEIIVLNDVFAVLHTSDITTQGTAPIPIENDPMYTWARKIVFYWLKGGNVTVIDVSWNVGFS